MGDVIDFRREIDSAPSRPPSGGTAEVITFTGGWHRPMNGQGTTSQPISMAAWYARVRRKISRALALLWPRVSESLRGTSHSPGSAAQVTILEKRPIPGEAKRGGAST